MIGTVISRRIKERERKKERARGREREREPCASKLTGEKKKKVYINRVYRKIKLRG